MVERKSNRSAAAAADKGHRPRLLRHGHSVFVRSLLRIMIAAPLASGLLFGHVAPLHAEAQTVRIAYQFGLGFLPITVALDRHFIEDEAQKLGLGTIQVEGVQLSGAAIMNDSLLSGSIDVAASGIGAVLELWDKSNGAVKGLVSLNDMALLLTSNDPRIRTVADYLKYPDEKIALPAIKIGAHANVLQMAAMAAFGPDKRFILDKMTVALPHPEGYAALVGGHSEIRSHFTSIPYSLLELQSNTTPIHLVLSSYDVLGGPHVNTLLYTTRKFAEANPRLQQAVFNGIVDAEKWINDNSEEAAAFLRRTDKSVANIPNLAHLLQDRSLLDFLPAPKATMKFAKFYYESGMLRKMPGSWKDYFWPAAASLDGS